jgi:outer membrane protein assembly factor BamB
LIINPNRSLLLCLLGVLFASSIGLRAQTTPTIPQPKVLWKYKSEKRFVSGPCVLGDKVFESGFDNQLHCVSVETGKKIWTFPTFDRSYNTPATDSSAVYFGCTDKYVYAVYPNGRLKWKYLTEGIIDAPAVYHKGVVYIGSGDQYLHAIRATDGEPIWRFKTDDAVFSAPCVTDSLIYFASNDGYAYAIETATAKLRWKTEKYFMFSAGGTLADSLYVQGCANGYVYAFRIKDGSLAWKFRTEAIVRCCPIYYGNYLYIGSNDKYFYALRVSNGTAKWKQKGGGEFLNTPLVVNWKGNPTVVASNYDGKIYGMDPVSGDIVWQYTGKAAISANPVLAQGRLLFGDHDGYLYCLDLR